MKSWKTIKRIRRAKYSLLRIPSYLSRMKWWFLHRTFNRFHIVDTNLCPGYYDMDTRLEGAMESLFVEYIEKELGIKNLQSFDEQIVYYDSDDAKEAYLGREAEEKAYFVKLKEVYTWYTIDKVRQKEEIYKNYSWEKEEEIYNKDTEVMKFIVENRGRMWT